MTYIHCEVCKGYFPVNVHGDHELVCKATNLQRAHARAANRRTRAGTKVRRGRGRMKGAGVGRQIDRVSYLRMRKLKRKKARDRARRRKALGLGA